MRVIEHEDFLRQPPDNALPTVHFPLCLRRNAGLRPGIFVRSVHSVHPVHSPFLKGDRRRRKAAPTTPMLHYSSTPFRKLSKISAASHLQEAIKSLRSRFRPPLPTSRGSRPSRSPQPASRRRHSPSGFYIRNSVFHVASSPPRPNHQRL